MPRDGLAWYGGRILVCEHNLLMAEACRFAALSPDCRNPTAGRPNYGRLGSGQSGGRLMAQLIESWTWAQ